MINTKYIYKCKYVLVFSICTLFIYTYTHIYTFLSTYQLDFWKNFNYIVAFENKINEQRRVTEKTIKREKGRGEWRVFGKS